jgi:hypothetical protein
MALLEILNFATIINPAQKVHIVPLDQTTNTWLIHLVTLRMFLIGRNLS